METPTRPENSAGSPPAQFEFTGRQNAVIGPLARDMVWVAAPLLVVGILYAIGLVLSIVRSFQDPQYLFQAALIGLAMAFYLALGTWTRRSAQSFQQIVSTQGQDINHLMDALENLGKMYGLLSLLVKVYVVVVGIAVVLGLITAVISGFRG
jgi:hypothetical protein